MLYGIIILLFNIYHLIFNIWLPYQSRKGQPNEKEKVLLQKLSLFQNWLSALIVAKLNYLIEPVNTVRNKIV